MGETQNFAACARFDAELEAYLEGETRPFIATHSRNCGACNALMAELIAVGDAARNLPLEEPPDTLWGRVQAGVQAERLERLAACAQFAGELEPYLEGESRPFVSAHAQDCAACGAQLADFQAIQNAARELPLLEPPPTLWARVRAGLESEGVIAAGACAQFDGELQAFLEGESRPFVTAHVAACSACAGVLADLQWIRRAARELPQAEPSRVVWANVRARLEAEGAFHAPVSGWRQLLAWRLASHAAPFAIMGALVFLGTLLILPSVRTQHTGGAEQAGLESSAQVAAIVPAGEVGTLAGVVSDLESSFRANEASMAPDLKATYEKSLVSLDGSIRECLDSLQHEPRNTLAHDYLLTAYTRKAEVLSSALEFEGR